MVAGPGRQREVARKRPGGNGFADDAEQFTVVDAHTVTVTLPKPDRLALANLATPLAPIFNSKLAKEHATPEDPWAQEWLKTNTAEAALTRSRPSSQANN